MESGRALVWSNSIEKVSVRYTGGMNVYFKKTGNIMGYVQRSEGL